MSKILTNDNTNNGYKGIYIRTIQACDIYCYANRNATLNTKYTGMLPYSLESIKLLSSGLTTKLDRKGKLISNDIINLKFSKSVLSAKELKKELNKKIKNIKNEINNKYSDNTMLGTSKMAKGLAKKLTTSEKYLVRLETMLANIDESWNHIKCDDLRQIMDIDGFDINVINKDTGELINTTHYVTYKRSGAKSRTGQCLYIKESLYADMIKWSRMGLDFGGEWCGDYAGVLAYESLVGSSLEDTMFINPDNILMVDDVESYFKCDCNVVRTNPKTKLLDSYFEKDYLIKNSLFDGESLLDCSVGFNDGYGFKLLRNHFTKTAAFNTNIQLFLKEHCPEGQDYDTWIIHNNFCDIYAKDVLMIMCPSSLKCIKFSKDFNMTDRQMFEYWKDIVRAEGNMWGICKHEKISKRGTDSNGNIVQQTSYQMLNSLPLKVSDMNAITAFEKQFITKLKNDDSFFIKYLDDTANNNNTNQMMSALAKYNPKIMSTLMFKDMRADLINKYVTNCKKGKVKLTGDYCVMLGNPIEYLYHAIGFDVLSDEFENTYGRTLKGNQVYTNLHETDHEFVGFRNPHTSPSNILVCENVKVPEINKYFNLTKNIICINAISFAIQDILSSCDYDSDTVVIFDHPHLLEVAKKAYGKYFPCINAVNDGKQNEKKEYNATNDNLAIIDNELSKSQAKIGKPVKGIPKVWINKQNIKIDSSTGEVLDSQEEIQKKELYNRILLNKYPYFFKYRYKDAKKKYDKYVDESEMTCHQKFKMSISSLSNLNRKTPEQKEFIDNYYKYMPLTYSNSSMNLLCKYIEGINFNISQKTKITNNDQIIDLYKNSNFKYSDDIYYNIVSALQSHIKGKQFEQILPSETDDSQYSDEAVSEFKTDGEMLENKIKNICNNPYIVVNCLIDYFYKNKLSANKDILWNTYGKYIFSNVKINTNKKIYFPFPDIQGDIVYMGKRYVLKEVKL